MSWCDKLASTPVVGLVFDRPHFAASDQVVAALTPLLDRESSPTVAGFTLESQDSFGVQLITETGFRYAVNAFSLTVSFHHRLRAKAVSGGPPIMEMLTTPAPFTELLQKTVDRLVEATTQLPDVGKRQIGRFAIVSATNAALADLPPGIAHLLDYLSKPWGQVPEEVNVNVLSSLGSGADWRDRCGHIVAMADDPEKLLTVNLDYQRIFTPARATSERALQGMAKDVRAAALSYFEHLAEGLDQHDEQFSGVEIDRGDAHGDIQYAEAGEHA